MQIFYRLSRYSFVRNANNYLQLTDTRNYSMLLGDYTSYIFAKYLDYAPKDIDEIVKGICSEFSDDTDFEIVKKDAQIFFDRLVEFSLVEKSSERNNFHKDNISTSEKKEKILLSKDELKEYMRLNNEKPILQNVIVEITKRCNERCSHCYIPHENKIEIMADADFYSIVEQCKSLGTVVNFRISGGECMTHPSFKKFIRYVKENGFALTVLTNLTLLDDETVEILKEGTLSSVQVSMFSTNPDIHDGITKVQGSLKKTMQNLEKLYREGIPVSIATQAMEMNKDSIENLYKYANSCGANLKCDWTIIAKENRDSSNLSCRICNLKDYEEICRIKLKYIDGYKDELKDELSRPPKSLKTHLCNAGANGIQIDTFLNVHPCPGWDFTVGNLRNKSLADVWFNSEKLQKVRNVILSDFPKCAKCDIRNLCSICMAQADLENKSDGFIFEMPDYMCEMYHVVYNKIDNDVLKRGFFNNHT